MPDPLYGGDPIRASGRLFLRNKTGVTKGEHAIISGICQNRRLHSSFSNQLLSHCDAWKLGVENTGSPFSLQSKGVYNRKSGLTPFDSDWDDLSTHLPDDPDLSSIATGRTASRQLARPRRADAAGAVVVHKMPECGKATGGTTLVDVYLPREGNSADLPVFAYSHGDPRAGCAGHDRNSPAISPTPHDVA